MTTTAPELLREQVAIMLAATCFHAKRQARIVGTPECPTAYDLDHQRIDELLDQYQAAR